MKRNMSGLKFMKSPYSILLLTLLFLSGVAGGYFIFKKVVPRDMPVQVSDESLEEEFFSLRIYYPLNDQLWMEERMSPSRTAQLSIAEAVLEEFLKGPVDGVTSAIPEDSQLLGVYKDTDHILYIDLSDEFRRNFQGDAYTEFFLLKALYESLISNLLDIRDVKVLIEGKEIETLGGHLYLLYPLKDTVSQELG